MINMFIIEISLVEQNTVETKRHAIIKRLISAINTNEINGKVYGNFHILSITLLQRLEQFIVT